MKQSQPLIYKNQPCCEVVQGTTGLLNQAGLQVLQTFNSSDTAVTSNSCTCLHHGTDRCDCQMVVLLIYGAGSEPIHLMVHGYDGQTWLSLVETFHGNDQVLEDQVRSIITYSEPVFAD